jgi:hypothetical protein
MKPQLTLEAFADWCEKQPARRKYDWASEQNCAVAQYAAFLGMTEHFSSRFMIEGHEGFWVQAEQIALRDDYVDIDTFGRLATRLRTASAKATS